MREAKARGVDVTGETCPQYLFLSTDDYARFGGVIRVNPPVREKDNQEPIWAALKDGTIDMIATDHAPHTPEEKTRNDIWAVDCGFPGVETQMPAMLTAGECRAHVDLRLCALELRSIRRGPGDSIRARARSSRARMPISRWSISTRAWTIDDAKIQSRSKISPWHGRTVKGLPIHTIVRGRFVMRDRGLMADTRGYGRSVHTIQQMPVPDVRNADKTMRAVTRDFRSTPIDRERSMSNRQKRLTHDEAFVELENVELTYGRGDKKVQALTSTSLKHRARRFRRAGRAVRLRQVDDPEARHRTAQGDQAAMSMSPAARSAQSRCGSAWRSRIRRCCPGRRSATT